MDTSMEIFALKDAFWKLTTRVAVIENFITEKFGSSAFSVVHQQISTTATNSCTNCKTNSEPKKPQIEKKETISNKSKIKPMPASLKAIASKRKSEPASTYQAENKKSRVSQRINYNEDSADEGTSSDVQICTVDPLESENIKIEYEEYDSNDYNYQELTTLEHVDNEDGTSNQPKESEKNIDILTTYSDSSKAVTQIKTTTEHFSRPKPLASPAKIKSRVWKYFVPVPDGLKSKCNVCGNLISRGTKRCGQASRLSYSTSAMRAHLKAKHTAEYEEMISEENTQTKYILSSEPFVVENKTDSDTLPTNE